MPQQGEAEGLSVSYVAAIPEDYAHKAALPAMSYERVTEMLAERFHMDEAYLKEINPGADFTRPGTQIKVMATGDSVTGVAVTRIDDKVFGIGRPGPVTEKLAALFLAYERATV